MGRRAPRGEAGSVQSISRESESISREMALTCLQQRGSCMSPARWETARVGGKSWTCWGGLAPSEITRPS